MKNSYKIKMIARKLTAAKWLYTLDLHDFWGKSEELGAQEVAKQTAERLDILIKSMKKNPKVADFIDDLEDVRMELVDLGEEESTEDEDFNIVFERLYDIADSLVEKKDFYNDEKLMWVKTNF